MQIFALNDQDEVVQASEAVKQQDYFCLECRGLLRLRSGQIRQGHFYHVRPNDSCRMHQKSLKHLQVQWRLLQLLGQEECQLECRFPQVNRIADCVWLSEKIIFEVQCSPIPSEEVLQRNRDYSSQGYQVVWLLHDSCFNQVRLSAAEHALATSPHYFTDIDRNGKGVIYDQYAYVHKGVRCEIGPVQPLNLLERHRTAALQGAWPRAAALRVQSWPLFFGGDLVVQGCKTALHIERKWDALLNKKRSIKLIWSDFIVKPYLSLFRYFLESVCD